ncbi:hypothetical protein [Bosea sp. (in: a-proteobacteria)]|uniref:hypothetical protein n=1 Tax=Bosea sp. (in: a-proteobacteria) TaxID=1871050 RepID=UPI003F72CAD9
MDIYERRGVSYLSFIEASQYKKIADEVLASGISRSGEADLRTRDAVREHRLHEALRQMSPLTNFYGAYLQDKIRYNPAELDDLVNNSRHSVNVFRRNKDRVRQTVEKIYDISKSDPEFAKVIDEIFGRSFGSGTRDTSRQILESNPEFAGQELVKRMFDGQGKLAISVGEMKALVQDRLKAQDEAISILRNEYNTSMSGQVFTAREMASDLSIVRNVLQAQADLQRRAAESEASIQSLRSATYIVATLLPDQKASRALSGIVNATLDAREALQRFEANIDLLSENGGIGSIQSATILTGNLLAIGLQLADAFRDTGPTADQIIIDGIVRLSDQISAFQDEVRTRFDRIDSGLIAIYSEMTKNFSHLASSVRDLRSDLSDISKSMSRMFVKLDIIESKLSEKLDLLIDQSFRNESSLCLNYAKDHGYYMSRSKFAECVGRIRAYLTEAKSTALSGAWDKKYHAPDLLRAQIGDQDWARHINLFRGMVAELGGVPVEGRRPNPARWLVAARTFTALASANSDAFHQATSDFVALLTREGRILANEMAHDWPSRQFAPLVRTYDRLLASYVDCLSRLSKAASLARANRLKELNVQSSDVSPDGVSSGDDTAQSYINNIVIRRPILRLEENHTLAAETLKLIGSTSRSDNGLPPIAAAEGVWREVLRDVELLEAELLGLGTIELRYIADWRDTRSKLFHATNFHLGKLGIYIAVFFVPKSEAIQRMISDPRLPPSFPTVELVRILGAPAVLESIRSYDRFPGMYAPDQFSDVTTNMVATLSAFGLKPVNMNYSNNTSGRDRTLATAKYYRGTLLESVRKHLLGELSSPAGNLAAAVADVEGIVFALRGLSTFVLPGELLRSDEFRQLLYGQPALVESTSRDNSYSLKLAHLSPPLLTASSVLALVASVERAGVTVSRNGGPATPAHYEATDWPAAIILRDLENLGAATVVKFSAGLQRALARPRDDNDGDPAIFHEVARLVALANLREIRHWEAAP